MQPSNRAAAILLGIVTTILLGWVLKVGAGILQPIVIALLLASMLSPVVRGLARFGLPPLVSVLGMVTLLGFAIFQGVVIAQANIEAFLNAPSELEEDAEARAPRARAEDPKQVDDEALAEQAAVEGEAPGDVNGPDPVDEAQAADSALPAQPSDGVPNDLAPTEGESSTAVLEDPTPSVGEGAPELAEGVQGVLDDLEVSDDDPGFLDRLETDQAEAIEEAGGLSGIVVKLIDRVESSSLPEPVIGYLKSELQDLLKDDRAQDLGEQLFGGGLSVFRTLILVLVYMLFIFAEQAVFRRKILAVAGERRADAERILDTIGRGIQQFLGIKTLISLATAALCYSVMVSLRIPYALLFALLTFFLNFIPYFGSLIAGLLPTVTAVAIEPSIDKAAIIAITYFAVNVVLGSYVEPKILGRELDLSPLVIIISVVVWGALWGVVGAFLAVPLTATAQIVLASSEPTRPIAVMLSSGPPREARRGLRRTA